MELVALRPVAPSTATFSKASRIVFTSDRFIMKVILGDGAIRPIQLNPEDLYLAAALSSFSSIGSVGTSRLSEVPSLGALLNMWFAASRLPAPGMLRGTTFGVPG